jgi:tetratricopeptide (TPR) repeat protein
MATMQIFVSHSHSDNTFCQALVQALRDAEADVWYDEHNLGAVKIRKEIEQELRKRLVFLVILSPQALTSQWVEDECDWAYDLYKQEPQRVILPIIAKDITYADIWLFLRPFKRIEDEGCKALSQMECMRRTLGALQLTPIGQPSPPLSPTGFSIDDLITQGKALQAQSKHQDALAFFQVATTLTPQNEDAWLQRAYVLDDLQRYEEALICYDKTLTITPQYATCLVSKGLTLIHLKRYAEALACFDKALVNEPQNIYAWNNQGVALNDMKQYEEALTCYDKALAINPQYIHAWCNKAISLRVLKRYEEALTCYDKALFLNPQYADAWYGKGRALHRLGRIEEANIAFQRARELGYTEE